MIWLIAIGSSLYSLSLVALGFYCHSRLIPNHQIPSQPESPKPLLRLPTNSDSKSGALKSMTPLERIRDENNGVEKRIEELLN